MRWFRSHMRFGSRLALFALAMQISLCFAHIDCCELGLVSAQAAPGHAEASVGVPGKGSPADKSDRSADRTCPICALIQLASTSTPAAAPALPLPTMLGYVRLDVPDAPASPARPHLLFQARAPPSV
jgi:hypothetical protein